MPTTVRRIDELYGYEIVKTEQYDDSMIKFYRSDGAVVKMHHHQDCCESVYIEDVSGDLSKLTGLVVEAEEVTSDVAPTTNDTYLDDAVQWTFYKIGTVNEFVYIRWLGTSNGYYGIDVNIDVDYN